MSENLRILLVDDDEIDRNNIRRLAQRKNLPYDLFNAETESEALEKLRENTYDIVLLDYNLGASSGLDLLPDISAPVIFITGGGSEEVAVDAMRRGASDYLIKDPACNYLTILPLTIEKVIRQTKAEKEFKVREARFRALTEKVSDLVVILDNEGMLTYISPSSALLGYEASDIVGSDFRSFVHPEDLPYIEESVAIAARCPYKSIRIFDTRIRHKDGTWLNMEGALTGMPDQPGVEGIVFSGRDISLRKNIQNALNESEEKFRTTLASISDLVFSLDEAGVYIDYHHPADHPDLIVPSHDFLGKCYKDVLPPKLAGYLKSAIEKAVSMEQTQVIEYSVPITDRETWYEAKISIRTSRLGEFKGTTIVARNITDRKQAENDLQKAYELLEQRVGERTKELQKANEKLMQEVRERKKSEDAHRKSEERLHKFMDSATESFFLLDSNLDFMNINERGIEVLGRKREEIVGVNIAEIVPDCKPSGRYEQHLEVLRTGEPFTIEDYLLHTGYGEFNGILKSFKVGDGVGVLLIDTTESRKLEEQLRQSQKMEAVGSLAGGIAHDFNNLLGVIMGFTYLVMDDIPEDTRAAKNLVQVLSATDRAKELVRRILTFSRKGEMKRNPVLLNDIVGEVLKLLRSTLPASIHIRHHIEAVKNHVMADSTQIQQVIMNICTNAAHAMRDKGGILKITLKEIHISTLSPQLDLEPGRYQQLTFSDTGHGMAPDVKIRIFEPYFTTKEHGEGSGLGMAMVHGIIKGHDGEITVESEPGHGTSFSVYLPVTEEEKRTKPVKHEPVRGGSERILLVDDEPDLLEMSKQMLERLGYTVESHFNSRQALKVFENSPENFDLLVTDQTMPDMSGVQLVEAIRTLKPNIPVVLFTGFSESINEENYASFGIDAFLMKPIKKKKLAAAIRRVLEPSDS